MSIVVRELIIRARVEEANAAEAGRTKAGDTGNAAQAKTEDIVALCVERVLEAIESKKER